MGFDPFAPLTVLKRIEVIAIGVSAGGPDALLQIIPRLPADFEIPIICVLHMPPGFTDSFADLLDRASEITVLEGSNNQPVEAGHIYLAPGGNHMIVNKSSKDRVLLKIIDSPPINNCKPSVDVFFHSAAHVFNGNILAVVLTGLGKDGTMGVDEIRRLGGYAIVQDKESSVSWGMPGSIVKNGNADEILPLFEIADRLIEIVEMFRGI